MQHFKDAHNMTDRFNPASSAGQQRSAARAGSAQTFPPCSRTTHWSSTSGLRSSRRARSGGNILPAVRQLMKHPDFQLKNPNRARSVIFALCNANPGAFHRNDAAGYVFWSERVIEIDAFNPQVAARLARAMDRWKKLAEPYRSAARSRSHAWQPNPI
ncbi:MAG: aminopeptidase N C-terminal domain-containing protein [Burkholderiaceae bacterium]